MIRKRRRSRKKEDNFKDWITEGTLVYKEDPKSILYKPIAGFDFDDTLTKYDKDDKSGKIILLNKNVISKLKEVNKTHRIVIFTNESIKPDDPDGLSRKIRKLENFKKKLRGIPIDFYIATGKDKWRKPCIDNERHECVGSIAMFKKARKRNIGEFYVGDAVDKSNYSGDADKNFARLAKVAFYEANDFFKLVF